MSEPEDDFVDMNNFDFIGENEDIKVFYLEAPLSFIPKKVIENLGNMLITLNAYHTGMGFVFNNKSLVLDYTAKGGLIGTFLPQFDYIKKGELVWDNKAYIEIGNEREQLWEDNKGYWKKSTYLTTINKDQFLILAKSIKEKFLITNASYVFFGVKNAKTGKTLIRESICDGFCKFVIDELAKSPINAKFDFLTYPVLTTANNVTNSSVKKLDTKKDKNEILNFYKNVFKVIHMKKHSLFSNIETTLPWIKHTSIDLFNHLFMRSVFSEIYEEMRSIILYSYDNDKDGKLCYYKVIVDGIDISYSEVNIPKNVIPAKIIKKDMKVNDLEKTKQKLKEKSSKSIFYGKSIFIITLIILLVLLVVYILVRCCKKIIDSIINYLNNL